VFSLGSRPTVFLLGISLVFGIEACGGKSATLEKDSGAGGLVGVGDPDSGAGGVAGVGDPDSGAGGVAGVGDPDSGAGGVSGSPGPDSGRSGAVATPDADAGMGGSITETRAPASVCAQIRVPTAKEEPIHLRTVSSDENGVDDGAWSVVGTCRQDSTRSSTCYTNVPAGDVGPATQFKVQVQTPESSVWIDLEIPLLIVRAGVATPTAQVVWQSADMEAWLTGYGEEVGSWCGANQPLPRSNWLRGTIDMGALGDDFKLPSNVLRFGPPIAADGSALVGAKSVLDDPGFLTMWNRAKSGSNDVDADGVPDDQDNCLGRAGTNQSDVTHNGIGDTCEADCYIPSTDRDSAFYDLDADGVDDICDNHYTRFNPAQYANL